MSLVIPTYNGGDRLGGLFVSLTQLTRPPGLDWEILVVDNNSQDNTAQVLVQVQAEWSACPLRLLHEPQQGAAFARWRALRAARGAWVAFLDDDNWPEPDWLLEGVRFATALPTGSPVAAFAGRVLAHYGAEPPPGFERIAGYLAVRPYPEWGDRSVRFAAEQLRLPPAAALWVRRAAWLAAVPPQPRLGGKRPGRLIQGDDYEPLLHLVRAGGEIWFVPGLVTVHQIPAARLERHYLWELARGCGLATYALRSILAQPGTRVAFGRLAPTTLLRLLRTVGGSLRRMVRLLGRSGWQVWRDPVVGAEWAFEWGCLLSPWVAWRLPSPGDQTSTIDN